MKVKKTFSQLTSLYKKTFSESITFRIFKKKEPAMNAGSIFLPVKLFTLVTSRFPGQERTFP